MPLLCPSRSLALLLASLTQVHGEGFLYFNNGNGPLHRSAPDGSNVTSSFAPTLGAQVVYLEVTHEFIYFSDTSAHTLNRLNLDGTGATVLAGPGQGIQSPAGLVRDKLGLVFANGAANKIQHYNLTTGALTDRVPGVNQPRGLALADGALFWIEAGTNKVFSSNGGELATISSAAGTLADLTVTASAPNLVVFVTARDRVYRIVDNSPFPPTITSVHTGSASSFFAGIAASDSTLYFNSRGESRVYHMPLAGGPAMVLHDASSVTGLNRPGGIDLSPIPRLTVNDPFVNESSGQVIFTVSLSGPSGCAIEVDYATSDDTALAPFDYTATSGTLSIPAGASSGTITVPIANDGAFELEETFLLTLSNPSFGVLDDALGVATILSQSTVASSKRNTWAQNLGWINWKPVTGTGPNASGAHALASFLTGKIWNQNVGWINLGNGAPDNGAHYSNNTAADFGVNLQPDGSLTGHAWGQNIGWITFEQTRGHPVLDYQTGRFSGYAWSQNCGWLNLGSDTSSYLQTELLEMVDSDHDMIDDAWELAVGAPDLSTLDQLSDGDGDGKSDFEEFLADTDPFDPASMFQVVSGELFPADPVDNVDLTWTSSPARLYDIVESPDLLAPFALVLADVPGAGPTTTVSLTVPPPFPSRDFWRVGAKLPLQP